MTVDAAKQCSTVEAMVVRRDINKAEDERDEEGTDRRRRKKNTEESYRKLKWFFYVTYVRTRWNKSNIASSHKKIGLEHKKASHNNARLSDSGPDERGALTVQSERVQNIYIQRQKKESYLNKTISFNISYTCVKVIATGFFPCLFL